MEHSTVINVFISSSIQGEKYNTVRHELKEKLNETGLFNVFVFEDTQASTLSAQRLYMTKIKQADVVIFLIDNCDGVKAGVLDEINEANKYKIKSLYYFCDENEKRKTDVEERLIKESGSKFRTVSTFNDFIKFGFQGLIEDILNVYKLYCDNDLDFSEKDSSIDSSKLAVGKSTHIRKTELSSTDKCEEAFLKLMLRTSWKDSDSGDNTNTIDNWTSLFFKVVFEGQDIECFNTNMFLESVRQDQGEVYNNLVGIRWKAIQYYYDDDIASCLNELKNALAFAKDNSIDEWVINDILIDIRNAETLLSNITNKYEIESDAQKQLKDNPVAVYYPYIDRYESSLSEMYVNDLFKQEIQSPFTVTYGNNCRRQIELIAHSFLVAVYNGSITHILQVHNRMQLFYIYMSDRYSEWEWKKDLLKLTIYLCEEKKAEEIIIAYPDILRNMNSNDAKEILEFCCNNPNSYKRRQSKLIALKTLGDYYDEDIFNMQIKEYVNLYTEWFENEQSPIGLGALIIKSISNILERIDSHIVVDVIVKFFINNYSRYYFDIFKCLLSRLDFTRLSKEDKQRIYDLVIKLLKEKTTVSIIGNAPVFLIRIRQDDLVSDFTVYDNCIKEALPTWYEECYKVQFTKNIADDYKTAIEKYLDIIHSDNLRQGKNGYYYESGVRTFDSIKNLLLDDDFSCDRQLFIRIVSEVKDTLLISKEELKNKIDACNLLVYLITKYPEMMGDVKEDIKEIVNNVDSIGVNDRQFFSTNISIVPLRTAIMLLGLCVDEEVMTDLIENMSFLEDDIPSLIVNAKVLNNHLEAQQHNKENPQLDMIVFNNALLWINSKSHELRWYSTKLFLLLGKHSIYTERVNNMLIRITSDEGVYIKNLILNNLFKNDFIYKETIDTILSICENDYSFHIRNKVKRLKEKNRING